MGSIVFNSDCVEGMKQFPDKYFDLAVVDPPYGIGEDGRKKVRVSHARPNSYHRRIKYTVKEWDNEPPKSDFFDLLKRKSKNQIIFGANHFIDNIPFNVSSPCWIIWDKLNGDSDFADCEIAWTSFKTAIRKFSYHKYTGTNGGKLLIHPTQKPVALYDWIYKNYAEEGMKVLDTHLGSGSNRISAYKYKMDFTAFEIDKEYFDKQEQRYRDFISQTTLF